MIYYCRLGGEGDRSYGMHLSRPLDPKYKHTRPWSLWDVEVLEEAIEDQRKQISLMCPTFSNMEGVGQALRGLEKSLREARKELGLE